jgi:MFS family permease
MYLDEFRQNWRTFLSACLGMGLGSAFLHYTGSLFGPPLLAEFGWTKAQFALLGSFQLINLLFIPFAGHMVDRFGTRLTGTIGFLVVPLGELAFTGMNGNIFEYFAIMVLLQIFGVFTTTIVMARIIIEKFDRARGLALSLMLTASPIFGVIAAPLLGALIDAHGWRTGYIALAVACAVAGCISVPLMDRQARADAAQREARRLAPGELKALMRDPTLICFLVAMFLVSIPQSFGASQLKLIVMDNGQSGTVGTWMLSIYAGGVIVGRLLTGLALDKIPAHLIAITVLGLPAVGYLLLAAHVIVLLPLILGISVIGFALGAETDIGSFLLSRRFDNKNFSFLISLMSGMVGLGGAAGSIVMSLTLQQPGGTYRPFLLLSAAATLFGAVLFSIAGRSRRTFRDTISTREQCVVEAGDPYTENELPCSVSLLSRDC